MTSCKSRKGLARPGYSVRGPHTNQRGLPNRKVTNHQAAGWHNCAIPAKAARSPSAQGQARAAAPGHRDLKAIRCSLQGLSLFFSEYF